MNPWVTNIILGSVQGVTEWLPISSSGHLALIERLYGRAPDSAYDTLLHLASLLVLVWFFRRDLMRLCRAMFDHRMVTERRLLGQLVVATAATIPLALGIDFFNSSLSTLLVIALSFGINAGILYLSARPNEKANLSYRIAAILGCAQGLAAIPAISRSGMVIASGLLLGLRREEAFRFGFLMGIPALAAAVVYKLPVPTWHAPDIIGFVVCAAVGYASLSMLKSTVMRSHFSRFWWYNAVIAVITCIFYARGF